MAPACIVAGLARRAGTGRLAATPEITPSAIVIGLRRCDQRIAADGALENPLITANRARFGVELGQYHRIGEQGAAFLVGALLAFLPRGAARRGGIAA